MNRWSWSRLVGLACLLLLLVLLSACGRLGIGAARVEGPRLSFQERSPDFGQVSASEPTERRLAFTNTGTRPLEIAEVQPEPPRPGG